MAQTKRCSRCGETKPRTEFYADSRASDGLQSACKMCDRARSQTWKAENPRKRIAQIEKCLAQRKPEKHRREARRHYIKHRIKILARRARKRAMALEYARTKRREHRRRRRARLAGLGEHYTAQEWRELCAAYGGRCLRCGKIGELEPDHVMPLSKGGDDTIENIQPLCPNCNKHKHVKTLDYRKRR